MATVSENWSKFAVGLGYNDLPKEVADYTKRLVLDTLGCAFGAYLSEPSKIVRGVLEDIGGTPECTIIGSGLKTSCPNATLVNGVMTRYLDYNDTYLSVESAHPSENMATALAVGERQQATGKQVITAIVLGYECHQRFVDVFRLAPKGWSHISPGGYIAPIVAGKLLDLTEEEIVNAIGIGGSHNHALREMYGEEGGQINMMKCIGWHFGAQSGVMAALMAKGGFTGPATIFESLNKVVGGDVDLLPLTRKRDEFMILKSCIKPFSSYYMSHSAITAVLDLRKKYGIKVDDVEQMNIHTFSRALGRLVQPAPETRESADHSLSYVLAIALKEGAVGPEQFAHEQFKDPEVRALIGKMNFSVDPEFDKVFPRKRAALIEIKTKHGESYSCQVDYPRGAPENPMTDEEIEAKFRAMASKLMGEKQIRQISDMCYNLEKVKDIGQLMKLLAV